MGYGLKHWAADLVDPDVSDLAYTRIDEGLLTAGGSGSGDPIGEFADQPVSPYGSLYGASRTSGAGRGD